MENVPKVLGSIHTLLKRGNLDWGDDVSWFLRKFFEQRWAAEQLMLPKNHLHEKFPVLTSFHLQLSKKWVEARNYSQFPILLLRKGYSITLYRDSRSSERMACLTEAWIASVFCCVWMAKYRRVINIATELIISASADHFVHSIDFILNSTNSILLPPGYYTKN